MIGLDEFNKALHETGLPVAYASFEENASPDPPFIIYYQTEETAFYADNIKFVTSRNIAVELYTEKKDLELEARLDAIFEGLELSATHAENLWTSEGLLEVRYELKL